MRHFERSTQGGLSAEGMSFAIVASRYNTDIMEALLRGAVGALLAAGADQNDIAIVRVPGAFELPLAVQQVLEGGDFDAAIALACVIRGDTPHFEYVAQGCTHGLMRVSLDAETPVGFGVLTTENQAQAEERARPDQTNKGWEAAMTALELAHTLQDL